MSVWTSQAPAYAETCQQCLLLGHPGSPASKGFVNAAAKMHCSAVCSLQLDVLSSLSSLSRWRVLAAHLPNAHCSLQINVSFFIVPNAYVLYNHCGVFAELVAVSGFIRWTCWNTVRPACCSGFPDCTAEVTGNMPACICLLKGSVHVLFSSPSFWLLPRAMPACLWAA